MYLICYVILHDHVIDRTWKFMGGRYLCYFTKSCDHKHRDGGDMFLICHVTSRDYTFKGLCEFMGGSSSW